MLKEKSFNQLDLFADGLLFCKRCNSILTLEDNAVTKLCKSCYNAEALIRIKRFKNRPEQKVYPRNQLIKIILRAHKIVVEEIMKENDSSSLVKRTFERINRLKGSTKIILQLLEIGSVEYFKIEDDVVCIDMNFLDHINTLGFAQAYNIKFGSVLKDNNFKNLFETLKGVH